MKKTYCTRLNFPWNSEKRFFRKNVSFNKFWRAPERARCYEVEYIGTIICCRAYLHFKSVWLDENWRKYIVHALIFLEIPKKRFFKSTSTSTKFGARQSARDVMTLSTSEILFDIEQVCILNRCDWMKKLKKIYMP